MTRQTSRIRGRRLLLRAGLAVSATTLGLPMLSLGSVRAVDGTPTKYSARAVKLVERSLVIDHVGIGTDSDFNGYEDMPADQRKELLAMYKSSYAFRDTPLPYEAGRPA